MPTPRQHGGAALQHIPLSTPGFMGLNTEQSSGLLGPEWATELLNATIDGSNRLASRKGWADRTTTPNVDDFISGFEYVQHDGTVELIYATDNATVVRSTDGGTSFSAITGTASFTSGQWHWINFANRAVGIQEGKAPIVYSGTSFQHIADVNAPQGGAGTSFAGRLWIAASDGHTMKYSTLLDETDWTGADAGSFNFQNVWTGTDTIQAIAAHNGRLFVFGKRNIIMISDGQGAALGIDPTQAFVEDVISGVGCISQESIQAVDGDLWFLSDSGLMSLGRVVQEKSNPLKNLSQNVRSDLMDDVNNITLSELRSVYSPVDRFYLLSLPKASGSAEVGSVWVFDTRGVTQEGAARCLGKWNGFIPTTLIRRRDDTVYATSRAYTGEVFEYGNALDNGAIYTFTYRSGWTDLGAPGMIKIFKRFNGVFFSDQQVDVAFKWAFDFTPTFSTRTKTFTVADSGSQWDVGLWGTAVWGGGGVSLREGKVVPSGSGEYIKWGVDATINNTTFSVQQLELFAKIGRLS